MENKSVIENIWKPYNTLDLDFRLTRIDTRDFHGFNCECMVTDGLGESYLKARDKYRNDNIDTVFTKQEIKDNINKIYLESGGKCKWRCLTFKGDKRSKSWIFKYLNIYKLDTDKYIIEGKQGNNAILLSKSVILKGIDLEYLNNF
jgi:hypothetical protein